MGSTRVDAGNKIKGKGILILKMLSLRFIKTIALKRGPNLSVR